MHVLMFVLPGTTAASYLAMIYLPLPPFIRFYILLSTKGKLVNMKQTDYMDSLNT